MVFTFEHLKTSLGITPHIERLILEHHDFLISKEADFYASIHQWALEHKLIKSRSVTPIFIANAYPCLISGVYDHQYYAKIYKQSLHWYLNGFALQQVSLFFSKSTQIMLSYAQEQKADDLVHALSLIIDFSRTLALEVFRLSRDMNFLKQRANFEIKRINQAFSLLSATVPQDLVQAYIGHQEWNIKLFSWALGAVPEKNLELHTIHNCQLTQWLDSGGEALIPIEQRQAFHTAHKHLHRFAKYITQYALNAHPEKVAQSVRELKSATGFIATTLLYCIDNAIAKVATHDPLTKLLNRTTLKTTWQQEIEFAQRLQSQVGVILIDIDHFKRVNDTYGHAVGDVVLVQLSQLLNDHVRAHDKVFRWGGEELLVMGLYDYDQSKGAAILAEGLRTHVAENTFGTPEHPFNLTISAGVVQFCPSQTHTTLSLVFEKADGLMYKAKNQGRNQVVSAHLNAE